MLRAKLEAVAVQPKPVLDKANSFGGRTALEREAPPSPSGGPSTQQLSLAEVAKHKTAKDAWIVLHGKVYDVTGFLSSHPVRNPSERADTVLVKHGPFTRENRLTWQLFSVVLLLHVLSWDPRLTRTRNTERSVCDGLCRRAGR